MVGDALNQTQGDLQKAKRQLTIRNAEANDFQTQTAFLTDQARTQLKRRYKR